jgi:hypothetical protein
MTLFSNIDALALQGTINTNNFLSPKEYDYFSMIMEMIHMPAHS